jgi:hypothetical protein
LIWADPLARNIKATGFITGYVHDHAPWDTLY